MKIPVIVRAESEADCEVSLEPRKLYQVLPDSEAAKHHQLRIADESGDDYLYPGSFFLAISLPERIAEQVALAA